MDFIEEDNQRDNRRLSLWAILLCCVVFVLIALDVSGDYKQGGAWTHIILEVMVLALTLIGMAYFGWRFFNSTQSKINLLRQDLLLANQQAQQWRTANRELISGLAAQIQQQFDIWLLTQAEAEVGMLMLKGLSHQEIADVRNASERTVRDQARAIYRKSGVAGRSELSAFFLEDLLLSRQQ